MANGGVLFPFAIANISTDNVYPGYSIDSAINGIPSKIYRSQQNYCTVTIEFPETKQITGIALINHNIPQNGSTIEMRLSNDGSTWTPPVFIPWNQKNLYYLFDQAGRYLQLFFSVPAGSKVEIGEIFPGEKWIFPKNYNFGYREILSVEKTVQSVNGQIFLRKHANYRGFELPFQHVDEQYFEAFARLIEAEYRVFIPDLGKSYCYHGAFTSKELDIKKTSAGGEFSLTFQENGI